MFRSSNPVLTRDERFSPNFSASGAQSGVAEPYGPMGGQQATYTSGQPHYGAPQRGMPQYGIPGAEDHHGAPTPQSAVMTIEDVATKFAMIMGVLILTAAAAWTLLPRELYVPALVGSGVVGLITVLFVVFRRKVSPALVLFYAAVEGVFVGVFSKIFEDYYDGIVAQAVFATLVVAVVVFAAYRFFNLGRMVGKFRKIVIIATAGFAVAMLANFALSFANIDLGLRAGVTGEVSPLAIGVSALGVILAAVNLILDFEFVENGVRNRLPANMSWVASFGLAVTMVWLYTEILRILSYLRR